MGDKPAAVERLCARGTLLVHFLDFAQLNSVRTLPYLRAWRERYAPLGLTVLGVNSPRYTFTADAAALAEGLGRLGVEHPIAADSSYEIWQAHDGFLLFVCNRRVTASAGAVVTLACLHE